MSTSPKKFIVRNLKLNEISSVDRPAQIGATVALFKRADEGTVNICKDAAAVAEGSTPSFGVSQYEDAMFERAAELAAYHRVTPEQALSKHLTTDRQLRDLAHAYEVARGIAYADHTKKKYKLETT